jgi:GT2 family glycosyltransferase
MPFFSTVIPSYNRSDLITTTIDSVLAQEFSDNEIIVVDDGSTDGTLDILAGYGSRIRILEQPNSGPGPARNLGAKHATGEYIAFLDSDDLWLPWTLTTYKTVITESPTTSVIAARHQDIKNSAALSSISHKSLIFQYYPTFFDSPLGWALPSGMILKAGALEAVGGYAADVPILEDADFWLRIGCASGFIQISSPITVGYRVHEDGRSQNWDGRARGVQYLIDAEKQGRYPGGMQYQDARRSYICQHARPISLACIRNRSLVAGASLYLASARWNLARGRLRYLAAFPPLLAWYCARFLQSASRVPNAPRNTSNTL